MQKISSLPVYSGVIPNKKTQNDYDFANNIFGFINYSGNTFIPFFNDTTTDLNILSGEINTKANEVAANTQTVSERTVLILNTMATLANGSINDTNIGTDKTFSSQKINNSLMLAGEIKAICSSLAGTYTIPTTGIVDVNGYMYCDGSAIPNGYLMSGNVPNLTDGRFLRGSVTAGQTGGAESFVIGNANLPSHNHYFSAYTSLVGNHTHGAWTDGQGNHLHDTHIGRNFDENKSGSTGFGSGNYGTTSSNGFEDLRPSSIAGFHGHNIGISGAGEHTHTVSGATDLSGSGVAITHIPKYVNVKYIIKVK